MFKTIRNTVMGLALSVAAMAGFSGDAQAYGNDYCREYTRTVYIGGRTQDAYGTACLQPDGSWMIVGEGLGNDIPANVSNVEYVIRDNDRYVRPNRVVYYDTRPTYYRPRPAPVFIWSHNSNRYYKHGHYVNYGKWDRHDGRWDRHDRHGRDDHRGRGRGHGRD